MDFTMEDGYCELDNSGCSNSTSTIDNWNDWPPVIDWAPFAGDDANDDFHSLIESMMMVESTYDLPESTTTSSESSPARILEHVESGGGDDKGLRLVHLLMAAAEALAGAHKSRELARVILVRLREMVSSTATVPAVTDAGASGNMERLVAHFTDALQGLLDGPQSGGSHHHHRPEEHHQRSDVMAAFQLLQDLSPYVKFGHFTANQAIIESVSGDRRVHIVDFDIMEGVQWASLMQAFVSQKEGPPPPHVRITAITRGGSGGGNSGGRKSMSSVQETGRRLVSFAASIGLPFSFSQCRLDPDEKFRPSGIKLVKGETLIANCVLHPPHLAHRSPASIASFLTGIATLNVKLITLVEEEGEIRKGDDDNGFVGRFMDELQRYSAIWDSLEAGFPMQGRACGLVEKVILGPTIAGAVGRAYRQREEKEGDRGWGDWMSSTMGFGRVGISFFNHCQARLLLGLFNDGYRVEEDAANKLVLGWKSQRLISASVWSAPSPSPSPSPPPSTTTSGFST